MADLKPDYEIVHCALEYYDGVIKGIADLGGAPHFFERQWDDEEQEYGKQFLVSPIHNEVFNLAMEQFSIYVRWQHAFDEGKATAGSRPALPEDRARYDELESRLTGQLKINSTTAKIVEGTIEILGASGRAMTEPHALQVKWTSPSQ